jgi:hypothetical protein
MALALEVNAFFEASRLTPCAQTVSEKRRKARFWLWLPSSEN